jgi:DNA gyrase subunit A
VISIAILRHMYATPDERAAFLKMRRAVAGEADAADAPVEPVDTAEEGSADATISSERYAQMSAAEQEILTISERGFGKRTSSYEYRVSGRGGKGIAAMAVNTRNGKLVASFPVEESDQLMLVTDGGQLIRCPVNGIRVAGRSTQGVIVFRTADDEKVVSVERITDDESGDQNGAEDNGATGGEAAPQ